MSNNFWNIKKRYRFNQFFEDHNHIKHIIMSLKQDLYQPTLLLDEKICRQNIAKMVAKASRNKVQFRPHFKTHQSIEIGEWFREAGVTAITVSSIKMATFFAEDGWKDITVAIPANSLEKNRINRLAKNINLNLITADIEGTKLLDSILEYPISFWIKIDVGYHRTGVLYHDATMIRSILDVADKSKYLKFCGFLTHAGHSYNCKNKNEIIYVHNESTRILHDLKTRFISEYPEIKISAGDTPTCSMAEDFTMVDEIRPGNFVFYDIMQVQITACTYQEIAVALACPVVAKHGDRNEIIIIGGGIHFSKDFILTNDENKNFGDLVLVNDNGWSDPVNGCFLSKLSQEHGTLKVTDEIFNKLNVGDIIGILPVHSCMTANLMGGYTTLSGKKLDYFDIRKEYYTQ